MITVVGTSGFIGSHLIDRLTAEGRDVHAADRSSDVDSDAGAGTVIYCRGLTRSIRDSAAASVESHVTDAVQLAQRCSHRFVYLSSLGVYRLTRPAKEGVPLTLDPDNELDFYSLCKLTAEAALRAVCPSAVALRLAKVFGDEPGGGHFLDRVATEAVVRGEVTFTSAPSSAKDFLHIDDLSSVILAVADATEVGPTYNIGTGRNTSNEEIGLALATMTGCSVTTQEAAPEVVYPEMDCSRARRDFDFKPTGLLERMPALVDRYRAVLLSRAP